jgi:S-adenosylmethionine:tRNA ribosyltransferase-isomerase
MQLNDFNFDLPPDLIARYPLEKRSASKLLCIDQHNNLPVHRQFSALIDLVEEGDLLIFNDTRVIPARLIGRKETGGQVEVLVERILDDQHMLAQVRASKALRLGSKLFFGKNHSLEVADRIQQFYKLRSHETYPILELIESIGQIPLPPYMQRTPNESDIQRYQTVYAKHKGSVAAPTAGLHFDDELLQQLKEKNIQMGYLTLHIGAGTFAPIRVDDIHQHKMHAEYFDISPELCAQIQATKARAKRVIAVGTTSLRALETASQSGQIAPYRGETSIFIYPGYQFRCVDTLITNMHLPRSTLLILVCAFGGFDKVMRAYREAVKQSYRFYSYGDAMWIEGIGKSATLRVDE